LGACGNTLGTTKIQTQKLRMRNEKKSVLLLLLSPNGKKKPKLLFSLNLNKMAPFS
jgi:hypothetical protein